MRITETAHSVAWFNIDAYANIALGSKEPGVRDVFPFTWTADEMGRIVRALVARKGLAVKA